jgi:DNA-directed RNA polymerase sigma subunit (sigma70/sigma32)
VKKNLREILPRLNHREKIILKNYFLKDQPDAYTVIGKELDLSRERIRNLKDALAIKLQKFFLRQQGPQDVPLDEEF